MGTERTEHSAAYGKLSKSLPYFLIMISVKLDACGVCQVDLGDVNQCSIPIHSLLPLPCVVSKVVPSLLILPT